MHELSICTSLLRQVEGLARAHGAVRVASITLRLGPLAGVEPKLLEQAYRAARCGTIVEDAQLVLERTQIEVRCHPCGALSNAGTGSMACSACGSRDTSLVSGDECLLVSVDLAHSSPVRR